MERKNEREKRESERERERERERRRQRDRNDNKSVTQKVADCDSPINEHMPQWCVMWTNNWQHLIFPKIKL